MKFGRWILDIPIIYELQYAAQNTSCVKHLAICYSIKLFGKREIEYKISSKHETLGMCGIIDGNCWKFQQMKFEVNRWLWWIWYLNISSLTNGEIKF